MSAFSDLKQATQYQQSIAGNPDYCSWPTYKLSFFEDEEMYHEEGLCDPDTCRFCLASEDAEDEEEGE